jgi:hypothetical protein
LNTKSVVQELSKRLLSVAVQQLCSNVAAIRSALFIRDGYLATTMAAVAGEAGVAVQSLYLRFGSKLEILKAAFDAAVVGGLEPVPLLERHRDHLLSDGVIDPTAISASRSSGRGVPSPAGVAQSSGQLSRGRSQESSIPLPSGSSMKTASNT